MNKRRLTPHQKIARAVARGTDCRLTERDIEMLAMDDAIMFRASLDDEAAKICNCGKIPHGEKCPALAVYDPRRWNGDGAILSSERTPSPDC